MRCNFGASNYLIEAKNDSLCGEIECREQPDGHLIRLHRLPRQLLYMWQISRRFPKEELVDDLVAYRVCYASNPLSLKFFFLDNA